jgi:signal transduction histidine kinase
MQTSSENKETEIKTNYSKRLSKLIHDLNNIIGPVSGYADLIRNDNCRDNGTPEDPKLAKRIEKIRICVEKAGEIIEKLNELKYELGKKHT